ncbi:U7-hexatoxin-Hi1a-like [Gastrophryne carolinensis]
MNVKNCNMIAGFYLLLIAFCLQSDASHRLVGGWTDRNPNDEEIQDVASFATAQYCKDSNSQNVLKLICVVAAKSQVVAGTLYNLTTEIGETNCKTELSTDYDLTQPCDPKTSAINKKFTCHFTIYERKWQNFRELKNSYCALMTPAL